MYNKFKKFVFNNFSKGSYNLVSKVEGKEEVYIKDTKMVVLIEDEEVGKRILEIAKGLKEWGEAIKSNHVTFKLTDFVADKFGTVKILFANIEFSFEYNWDKLSQIEKLRELVSFAHSMQENGYIIDDSIFNNDNCTNISDFISYFGPDRNLESSTNNCLIKYIHYVFSAGESMEEHYQPIIAENKLCNLITDFPYHMPIVQMCYRYCKDGIVPDDFDSILKAEGLESYNADFYYNKRIVSNPDLSANLPVTETTEVYTVYNNCIKIYTEISSEFREFLEDKTGFIKKVRPFVEESFYNWIIDFEGNIIGYEYKIETDTSKRVEILNNSFDNQRDILDFVSEMRNYIHRMLKRSYSDFETNKQEFNIETDLVVYPSNDFKVVKIEDLYNLVSDDSNKIDEEITIVFFKLLLAYLEKTYGKICNKTALYEKKEVRYLSPILAKEFCNFALNKNPRPWIASTAFDKFIDSDMKLLDDMLAFDSNFIYNPENSIPFLFEHEVEQKYGVNLERGNVQSLPDGRQIVTLWCRKSISAIKNQVESLDSEIRENIGRFNKYVNFVKISEIIYSLDLNSENMYHVVGYVTTPFLGQPLTMSKILSFNNKEILKIAGMLISNFSNYYIEYSKININITHKKDADDIFSFYINPLDENFRISSNNYRSTREHIKGFFDLLVRNGYNKNAFVDLDLSGYDIGSSLIHYSARMNTYCEEHKIYYDGDYDMCPVCQKTRCVINHDTLERHYSKVFEDEYAIHYRHHYNSQNLKVYKDDGIVDLTAVEKNINRIIDNNLSDNPNHLQQECFIPCKKALDDSKKFIGYVYDSIDFESSDFNDLKDTEHLENLPRIMSLIRLILQVKELMYHDFGFIKNPFGNVFLSKNHKKQVQLVNVDFLGKYTPQKNTSKWTSQYVRSIIDSDPSIILDTSKFGNNLDAILDTLKKYSQTLTMYCPIHKIYYSADYLFCPKCVDRKQLKKLDIEYITESEISSWKVFSQGGESIIYEYGRNSLAKIFKPNVNYSFKNKVLAAILSKSGILDEINNKDYKFKYIIPKKILVDKSSGKILGYVMDEKIVGKPLSVLKDKLALDELNFDRKDILEILITAGEGIQILHNKANIFIGDLNGRNILFDTDKNVYFLDFDGMGVDNISPLFWTEGYIDPVSKNSNNITKKDDWYSYAIQAFYYLTLTHPFAGIYKIGEQVLEIPDKMERRLSLLGHHGIPIPTITISWDWMNQSLQDAFLNIFEGDSRKSIVPELKAQYWNLYGENFRSVPELDEPKKDSEEDSKEDSEVEDLETLSIGSNFIAKRNNPFKEDVVRIINHNFAICKNENNEYYVIMSLNNSESIIHFPYCLEILDIIRLESLPIAFAIYSDKVIGFNQNTDRQVFYEFLSYDSDNVVINGNTLYLSKDGLIYQIEFDSEKVVKREKIKFLVDQETVGFLVKFGSKFMLVKRNKNGVDTIYCNSEALCDFDFSSDSKYNILYDDTTKIWLVISNKGKFITIKSSNGHHTEGYVNIPDMNVKNISFNKGVIYIPSQDNLHIVNILDHMSNKKMECSKIMTPDSHLCNFNSKGFSVITNGMLYDVSKNKSL